MTALHYLLTTDHRPACVVRVSETAGSLHCVDVTGVDTPEAAIAIPMDRFQGEFARGALPWPGPEEPAFVVAPSDTRFAPLPTLDQFRPLAGTVPSRFAEPERSFDLSIEAELELPTTGPVTYKLEVEGGAVVAAGPASSSGTAEVQVRGLSFDVFFECLAGARSYTDFFGAPRLDMPLYGFTHLIYLLEASSCRDLWQQFLPVVRATSAHELLCTA